MRRFNRFVSYLECHAVVIALAFTILACVINMISTLADTRLFDRSVAHIARPEPVNPPADIVLQCPTDLTGKLNCQIPE